VVATGALGVSASGIAETLERIIDVRVGSDRLTFVVESHGCTRKRDFHVRASRTADGNVLIALRRVRQDDCKGFFRDGQEIVFTRRELGIPAGAAVSLENRVARHESPR
jgi:hypothetical protein